MLDFYNPRLKRGYNIRLAIGLVLVAIVLILATLILALITAGYSIDHKNGQVYQNGLVFANSHPVSANIYINNTPFGTTNARLELPEGAYTFVLRKTGYDNWNNSFNLYGGNVLQLDYPFLFPSKPVVTNVQTFASQPDIVSESPNQHWLVCSVPSKFGSFEVYDVTNPKAAPTSFTLPTSVFSNTTGNLSVVEWSTDNQHILIKNTFAGGFEYILVDRLNPQNSFNITQLFSTTPFDTVRLDNKQFNKFYLYNSATGTLSVASVSGQTVTPALTNVLGFWPYSSNELVYATPDKTNPALVDAKLLIGTDSYTLRTLPVGSNYLLNIASYNGNSYVTVGSSGTNKVYVYMNPQANVSPNSLILPVPYTFLIVNGVPQAVTFSTSAESIAVQAGSEFAVYDIMTQTHYHYDTKLPLAGQELSQWMDGDRLTLASNGKLDIFDFDGTNMVTFTDDNGVFSPAFDSAFDAVYTMTPSTTTPGAWNLIRTSLIVPPPTTSSSKTSS
ncbi:MAG TPA: PEGA domain-containing protein [Candidatus Saccharimonadales bacterium]|nr:PEGA domain-containing protein [Candidatus Saccharimonadales bacterium]